MHINLIPQAVDRWLRQCLGSVIAYDKEERNLRFFEEACELVQAGNMSRERAHALVNHVYSRPVGDIHQEASQTFLVLVALANANKVDLFEEFDVELLRCWELQDKIVAKNLKKAIRSDTITHVTLEDIIQERKLNAK